MQLVLREALENGIERVSELELRIYGFRLGNTRRCAIRDRYLTGVGHPQGDAFARAVLAVEHDQNGGKHRSVIELRSEENGFARSAVDARVQHSVAAATERDVLE